MEQNTIYYISEAAKLVQVENHVLRYWEEELKLPIKRNEMGHRYYTSRDIRQLQEIKVLKEQGLQLKAIRSILPGMLRDMEAEGGEESAAAEGSTTAKGSTVEGSTVDKTTTADKTVAAEENAMERIAEGNGKQAENKAADNAPERKVMGEQIMKDQIMADKALEDKAKQMVMNKAQKYMVTLTKDKNVTVETQPEALEEYTAKEDDKSQKAARLQYLLQHMITEAVKTANQELCTEVKESILKELDYQFRMQEERDEERWKQEEEHYRKIDEMIRQRHKPKEKLGKGKKKSPIV